MGAVDNITLFVMKNNFVQMLNDKQLIPSAVTRLTSLDYNPKFQSQKKSFYMQANLDLYVTQTSRTPSNNQSNK